MKKRSIFDCGISANYISNGEKLQYYRFLQCIVRVEFDTVEKRRNNGTLLEDECGFNRIKTGHFFPIHRAIDEPFIFPKDVIQVFYVKDRINYGWEIVVKVASRSKLRYYERRSSVQTADEEDLEVDEEDLHPKDILGESNPGPNPRRTLVFVVADDSAGDQLDSKSSDEVDFDSEEEVYSDDDEVVAARKRRAGADFPNYINAELEDLESDGGLVDTGTARKNRL